jgi:hypothetical protein
MVRGGKSNSARGVAESTGDLAKLMGRFSLAMGLFAARQATTLLSGASSKATASLDDVSDAASRRATGVVKTALAIGTNIQVGLVDAALSLAGMGPCGQLPSGTTKGLYVPLMTGASRRVAGMQTVAAGAHDRPVSQAELIERLSGYQIEASEGDAPPDRGVAGLWKAEGLAATMGQHLLPENFLNDPALPRQVLPISHVGFGSGAMEGLAFDAAKLDVLFRERCAKDYLDFSYEGIGAALRFYERGFFKLMSGALDFIGLDAPDGPDPAGFFADYLKQFPPDIQRVITHGYGRIIAFSNLTIYSAIEEATALPSDRIEPAVHGAAFAFAMINSADLPRILRQSAVPYSSAVRAAFQNGLVYALVFLEWFAPGVLSRWRPQRGLEAELIDHARLEIVLSIERGFPLASRLATPRS